MQEVVAKRALNYSGGRKNILKGFSGFAGLVLLLPPPKVTVNSGGADRIKSSGGDIRGRK